MNKVLKSQSLVQSILGSVLTAAVRRIGPRRTSMTLWSWAIFPRLPTNSRTWINL